MIAGLSAQTMFVGSGLPEKTQLQGSSPFPTERKA